MHSGTLTTAAAPTKCGVIGVEIMAMDQPLVACKVCGSTLGRWKPMP